MQVVYPTRGGIHTVQGEEILRTLRVLEDDKLVDTVMSDFDGIVCRLLRRSASRNDM